MSTTHQDANIERWEGKLDRRALWVKRVEVNLVVFVF
jgi:hypothetical protein